MNKGSMGVGSSSLVLVFAVLCLTVFSLISLLVARNSKALADSEAALVVGYYEADTQAEEIYKKIIMSNGSISEIMGNVEIWSYWDVEMEVEIISFTCPVSDDKELYVRFAYEGNNSSILNWQMIDIGSWENDGALDVWLGDDYDDAWMQLEQ
ncbi:MAG: hypothetical protein FWG88_10785 [Oscillospiraceae bacterium]|nr:hypothetical protein [Oscillospiraceae bacterium]